MKCAYDSVYSCIYHMFCIFIFCCTTSYSTYVLLFVINLLTYLKIPSALYVLGTPVIVGFVDIFHSL